MIFHEIYSFWCFCFFYLKKLFKKIKLIQNAWLTHVKNQEEREFQLKGRAELEESREKILREVFLLFS